MKLYKINKYFYKSTTVVIIVSFFFSCNLTKKLKDHEQLLVKNVVEIDQKNFDSKVSGFETYDIKQVIKPKPNEKLFGFRMKLWANYWLDDETAKLKEKEKKEKNLKKKRRKVSRVSSKIRQTENRKKDLDENSSKYKKLNQKLINLQYKRQKKEAKQYDNKPWSRRNSEKPVIYNINDEYRNKRKIRILLKNKGYFEPKIDIKKKEKIFNKKKVKLIYTVSPGKPYVINKIKYDISDSEIKKLILSDTTEAKLKQSVRLDTKIIEFERKRLSEYIRNSGYYDFKKEYIYFSIDTLGKDHFANMIIHIKNPVNELSESINHKKYKIGNVFVYPNFNPGDALANKEEYYKNNDTIIFFAKSGKKYHFIYNDIPGINPKAITRGLYLVPGKLFNLNDIKDTYRHLAGLQIILIANVNFKEDSKRFIEEDTIHSIDTELRLTQDKLQESDITAEITNTSGNIGISGNLFYTHNNIFKNTEILDLKLNFAVKRITKRKGYEEIISDSLGFFNSKEAGFDLGFKFPRLLAPIPLKKFIKRRNPQTTVNAKYNFLKDPEYSTSVASAAFGYNWFSTSTNNHAFTPITGDFVRLINPTDQFRERIAELQLEEFYEDHFVFGSSYRFTFNNQFMTKKKNFFYFTTYNKLVGNSLSLVNQLMEKEKVEGSYTVFENVFAQFFKTEIDLRYYRKLNREKDKVVFRLYTGVAYPYGNLDIIPFSEQYFSGGANGLRAWQERTLGPGSYTELLETESLYPNQRSDMKLEFNFEYRMKLFWYLEGALFFDAGNIWAINNSDTREGALFEFNDFYREIALGSGFGFRLDFDVVVIRFDIARKLFDPSKPIHRRFVTAPDRGNLLLGNWGVNIGIGYPF